MGKKKILHPLTNKYEEVIEIDDKGNGVVYARTKSFNFRCPPNKIETDE